jgi:glutamate-1-semialdehyde 2,1-aminomutase
MALTLFHTTTANVEAFRKLFAEIAPEIPLRHVVRADLLERAIENGGVSPEIDADTRAAIEESLNGSPLAMCTCSTIGASADGVSRPEARVLRVDRPMAEAAVRAGERVLIAASVATTLQPTVDLVVEAAKGHGAAISIRTLYLPECWPLYQSGDKEAYWQAIAGRIREDLAGPERRVDSVVLAQASMAGAQPLLADLGVPVLASPRLGVQAAAAEWHRLTADFPDAEYHRRTPGSRRIFERAERLFPNGVTHVSRYLRPYPVYVDRAAGSRKWDVDGNEYIDYFGGHGALIAGHCHPAVSEAVRKQVERGVHYGASHELEVEWAELIAGMIPSAERVRFTISGTEATHLGLRVARAFTGRNKIIRFAGHFHGWHDHVSFPAGGAPGIVPGIPDEVLIVPANDIARVRQLAAEREDIAALILEPTGASFGHVPAPPALLHELREITSRHGIVLIFDEVICGFRCSSGGAQGYYGVTPDLTTVAKIVAGGYPGAALTGKAELFSVLEYDGTNPPRVPHQGTYNAGPVSAAAGIATLKLVRDTDLIASANRVAAQIRGGWNEAIRKKGLNWCVYGLFSDFHLVAAPGEEAITPDAIYAGRIPPAVLKGGTPLELIHRIRTGILCRSVDIIGWPGGLVSGVHTAADADQTIEAFRTVLDRL